MNIKKVLINYIKMLLLVIPILFFFSGISIASTHYVSNTGSATWEQSTNISTPCSASTAMSNATAGDIVYFRGGTYDVGDTPSYEYPALTPSNSGSEGSVITFKAYTGETPVFMVSDTCTDCQAAIGSVNKNYIVWDGVTVDQSTGPIKWKGIYFNNADHCVVKNAIFIGKGSASSDNIDAIRIDESDDVTVQSCIIHGYEQDSNWQNTSGIKLYHDTNIVVENCEIYDCAAGIFSKSSVDTQTYRYNYIHDCYRGMYATAFSIGEVDYNSDNGQLYDNVIINCTYTGIQLLAQETGTVDNWEIHDNTVYGCQEAILYGAGSSKIWDNIIQGSASHQLTGLYGSAVLAECDHNQFGTASLKIIMRLYYGQSDYTTLASWQSSGELSGGGNPGSGSLASDPKFVNLSGSLDELADFALAGDSPCKGTGRSGVDMGADISLVGLQGGQQVEPPTPPKNLRIE